MSKNKESISCARCALKKDARVRVVRQVYMKQARVSGFLQKEEDVRRPPGWIFESVASAAWQTTKFAVGNPLSKGLSALALEQVLRFLPAHLVADVAVRAPANVKEHFP